MDNKYREFVLKLFAKFNTNDINQVGLPLSNINNNLLNYFPNMTSVVNIEDVLDSLVLDNICCKENEYDEDWGDWICYYYLTKKGVIELKRLYGLVLKDNGRIDNINQVINDFKNSNINPEKKVDYVNTLKEMSDCFSVDCYNATISLCGKIIEIYLTELLNHFQIKIGLFINNRITTDLTLGQLYRLTKQLPVDEKTTYINSQNIELIKSFRNGTAHYNEKIPIPSKDQTEGIISFTLDALKRRISYNW